MRLLIILACGFATIAAPALASVPPAAWKGSQWTGPGLLCRSSFTLKLAEGETAEEQYPSVGLIRFVVRSDAGVFEVAEDWYRRPFEERKLIAKRKGGTISKVTEAGWNRTYVYLSETSKLPVLVRFDPFVTKTPSFTGTDAENSVLDRVSFGQAETSDCLEPVKREAAAAR
jgi:hypothetical protein